MNSENDSSQLNAATSNINDSSQLNAAIPSNNKQTRLKQSEKKQYIMFMQRPDVVEVLKTIPKHLRIKFLSESFEKETGIHISRYIAYSVKPDTINQVVFNNNTYVLC